MRAWRSPSWWFAEPASSRRRPGLPPVLWLATAAWVGTLLAYSLVVPLFRAPDELQHVDLVIASRTAPGYDRYDDTYLDARVVDGAHLVGRPEIASTGKSEDAISRHDRPTLEALGERRPAGRNQQTQHPPLYYASLGAASTLVTTFVPGDSAWSIDRLTYLLRLFNVALVAALPAIAYLTARRVGRSIPAATAAGIIVVGIPQLAHIGSSVNNDNLLVLLAAVAALGSASVSTGDLTRRRALSLGAVVGLALLTKSTAIVLPPMVAVAYLLHLRVARRDAIVRLLQCGAAAFVTGGWWMALNLVRFGSPQPSEPFWLVERDIDPVIGDWAERFFYLLPVRFWGQFGILEIKLNRPLVVIGTALLLSAVVTTLARPSTRRSQAWLLLPAAGAVAFVARKTWTRYLQVGRPIPGIQGRYLFVGIVGLASAVGSLVDAVPARFRRAGPAFVAILALLMHGAAMSVMIRDLWGHEVEPWADRLDDLRAFSPFPGRVTDLVLVGGATSVLLLVVVCVVGAVRARPVGASEEP